MDSIVVESFAEGWRCPHASNGDDEVPGAGVGGPTGWSTVMKPSALNSEKTARGKTGRKCFFFYHSGRGH